MTSSRASTPELMKSIKLIRVRTIMARNRRNSKISTKGLKLQRIHQSFLKTKEDLKECIYNSTIITNSQLKSGIGRGFASVVR